jgi:hypothetical protein
MTSGLRVFFKNIIVVVFNLKMYQNNIFFILKKLFLILVHQNDLKTLKNINLKQRKKLKNFKFFQKYFCNAETNRV